ncbi:hypothetical protein CJF32_00000696 [Rutstroemia sp. NJR-2017a WRK4]|nr:hypothetical protein CJF32_00000696 [Rutstroemia sp. NJR-2017a WRK4]
MLRDMRVEYQMDRTRQFNFLRIIRPLPGCKVAPAVSAILKNAETAFHSKVDVNGLDVMLVLLRHLISTDFVIEGPLEQVTEEEGLFYNTAWLDLGWDAEKDHDAKTQLLESLLRIKEFMVEDLKKADLSFEKILTHPKLKNLIMENEHFFHLEQEEGFGTPNLEVSMMKSDDRLRYDPLVWDGADDLDHYINRHLIPFRTNDMQMRMYFAQRPMFFQALYTPSTKFRSIAEIRTVEMKGVRIKEKESGETKFKVDTRPHLYILYAIVRLGDGGEVKDDVRTYLETGIEIIPQKTTDDSPGEDIAREEYQRTGKRWTIQSPGRYRLFYARIANNEECLKPETYIVENAPEFRPRSWAETEVKIEE